MLGAREILVAKLANFEAGLREKAKAQEAEFHAQVKARMVEESDWVNTQVAKFKELYDIQKKRIQLQEEYQRSLATAGKEQENQRAMTAAQEQAVAEREAAISRMRATGIIEIQVKGQVSKKYSGRNCET